MNDPEFASAVEKAYIRRLDGEQRGPRSFLAVHQGLLDQAIHDADPTNGGLRFKRLDNRNDLDRRLYETLTRHLSQPY